MTKGERSQSFARIDLEFSRRSLWGTELQNMGNNAFLLHRVNSLLLPVLFPARSPLRFQAEGTLRQCLRGRRRVQLIQSGRIPSIFPCLREFWPERRVSS